MMKDITDRAKGVLGVVFRPEQGTRNIDGGHGVPKY